MKSLNFLMCFLVALLFSTTASAYCPPNQPCVVTSESTANQFIVDFEDDLSEEEITQTLRSYGLDSVDGPYWEGTKFEIVVADEPSERQALKRLASNNDIEGIEPRGLVHALSLQPNDPLYKKQWHMKKIDVEGAWGLSVGRGVTVAVVDTGVTCRKRDGFHKVSDLNGTECVPGFSVFSNDDKAFDDHGHGTHVAGTIAQTTNNKVGGVGIAWGAKIMPVKVLAGNGSGTLDGVAAGIVWASDNGAQIINMSLGGSGKSKVLQRAVDYARLRGTVVIAAAGNSGRDNDVGAPANCDGVIAVSATDEKDGLAYFSSHGPEVDIGAPGTNVVQNTICDEGKNGCEDFPAWNGTSMATPHVAGVAALLVGQGISDPDVIEQYLQNTAKTLDTSKKGRNKFGAGRLQASSAVASAHWKQVGFRGFFMLLLSLLTFKLVRERQDSFKASPSFWVAAAFTSVGAFFLPLFLSRHIFWIDLVSRPLGDMTLLLGQGLHQYLPLANVFVPLGLASLFLKSYNGASQWLGGLFVGTAGYLVATVFMSTMWMPFGWIGTVWLLGNAAACVYVGSLVLSPESK